MNNDKIFIDSKDFRGFLPYVDAVIAAGTNSTLKASAIWNIKNRLLGRHDADTAENKARVAALCRLYNEKANAEPSEWPEIKEVLDRTDFRTISRRLEKR